MDPTDAAQTIRLCLDECEAGRVEDTTRATLAGALEALSGWLAKGGALPWGASDVCSTPRCWNKTADDSTAYCEACDKRHYTGRF
jgi:hypothetical protein